MSSSSPLAGEPFRLDELWSFASKLERSASPGFGWGAAWIGDDGALVSHRDLRAFRDDPATEALGAIETRVALVHLRRPSKLSTLTGPDTQPFDDPGRSVLRSATTATCTTTASFARRTGPRAGSTAVPTPRSGLAGSRTRGIRRSDPTTCWRRCTIGSVARRTLPS